ncbi:MAG: DUF4062 domain-containing protein [Clostridia bacterium]|nr:DUF4062 domain-containing protein [Clostridia bacterium]
MEPKLEKRKYDADKAVRLFVSSTFRDMQEEREALTLIFPAVTQFCRLYDLDFIPVDLRWGITEEEAQSDKTVEICLDEVSRCAPFFIGILGERYGWIPEAISEIAAEKYPWLLSKKGRSITEMELYLGMKDNPHCRIYERCAESKEAKDKNQLALKERIVKSGVEIKQYKTPSELARYVFEDIKNVISGLFSMAETGEGELHLSYARHAAAEYTDYKSASGLIDEYIGGSAKKILLLTGGAGSGKSSLLAYYLINYQPENTFFHFCGASDDSADLYNMVLRLLMWLESRYQIEIDFNKEPLDIINSVPAHLNEAAKKAEQLNIIIDGLELLENTKGITSFAWIPTSLPENIKLIISTRDSSTLQKIEKKAFKVQNVASPDEEDIKYIAQNYLLSYGKKLDEKSRDKIAAAKKSRLPFYLVSMLDELRKFGVYEELNSRIELLLSCESVSGIIMQYLSRLEDNMDRQNFELLKKALIYLYVSGDGLKESTLIALLGTPNAYTWALVFPAVCELCYLRVNAWLFKNDEISKAVEQYFKLDDTLAYALSLINCLIEIQGDERTRILPSVCVRYRQYGVLNALMSDMDAFMDIYNRNHWKAREYWKALSEQAYEMTENFKPLLESPAEYTAAQLSAAAQILFDYRYPKEAFALFKAVMKKCKAADDWMSYQDALGSLAKIKHRQCIYKHATYIYMRQSEICEQNNFTKGFVKSLGNLGLLYYETNNVEKALYYYQRALSLAEENNYAEEQQKLLGSIGYLQFNNLNEIKAAKNTFDKQRKLCLQIGSVKGAAAAYDSLSQVELKEGDLQTAIKYLYDEEKLLQKINDQNALQICLGNQGSILYRQGLNSAAISKYKKKIDICLKTGNKRSLMGAHKNLTIIYMHIEKHDKALEHAMAYALLATELKEMDDILAAKYFEVAASKELGNDYMDKYEELLEMAQIVGRPDVIKKLASL